MGQRSPVVATRGPSHEQRPGWHVKHRHCQFGLLQCGHTEKGNVGTLRGQKAAVDSEALNSAAVMWEAAVDRTVCAAVT